MDTDNSECTIIYHALYHLQRTRYADHSYVGQLYHQTTSYSSDVMPTVPSHCNLIHLIICQLC